MAKRGFFGRIIEAVSHIFGGEKQEPSRPEIREVRSFEPTPSASLDVLRNRAMRRMMRFPNANTKTVNANIRLATVDELKWIAGASDNQIRQAARRDPDRMDENYIPRNIAWYR